MADTESIEGLEHLETSFLIEFWSYTKTFILPLIALRVLFLTYKYLKEPILAIYSFIHTVFYVWPYNALMAPFWALRWAGKGAAKGVASAGSTIVGRAARPRPEPVTLATQGLVTAWLLFWHIIWYWIFLLLIHPLACFPGEILPHMWSIYAWWKYESQGVDHYEEQMRAVHYRFNSPIVRVGPDELHIEGDELIARVSRHDRVAKAVAAKMGVQDVSGVMKRIQSHIRELCASLEIFIKQIGWKIDTINAIDIICERFAVAVCSDFILEKNDSSTSQTWDAVLYEFWEELSMDYYAKERRRQQRPIDLAEIKRSNFVRDLTFVLSKSIKHVVRKKSLKMDIGEERKRFSQREADIQVWEELAHRISDSNHLASLVGKYVNAHRVAKVQPIEQCKVGPIYVGDDTTIAYTRPRVSRLCVDGTHPDPAMRTALPDGFVFSTTFLALSALVGDSIL